MDSSEPRASREIRLTSPVSGTGQNRWTMTGRSWEAKQNMQKPKGVLTLKENAQSLCYPYVYTRKEQKITVEGSKYGINCQPVRMRNGELLLTIAKRLIEDCGETAESLSAKFGVTKKSVRNALKKIHSKLGSGLVIPGLTDIETEKLARVVALRNERKKSSFLFEHIEEILADFDKVDIQVTENREIIKSHIKRFKKYASRLDQSRKEKTIMVFIEHVAKRLFQGGSSIAEIAGVVGIGKERVLNIFKSVFDIKMLARRMILDGRRPTEVAKHFCVSEKELENIVGEGWFSNQCSTFLSRPKSKSRPSSKKKIRRKPATISREGLAAWNKLYYDKNGILRLPVGYNPPSDLPRRYPRIMADILPPCEPPPSLIPAPPVAKGECTTRGRDRIRYMRLF